jgi:hypothetical protein
VLGLPIDGGAAPSVEGAEPSGLNDGAYDSCYNLTWLISFRVRVHGGHLVGKSLRHVKAVEDANADPADLTWLIFGGFGREVPVD